MFIDNNAG